MADPEQGGQQAEQAGQSEQQQAAGQPQQVAGQQQQGIVNPEGQFAEGWKSQLEDEQLQSSKSLDKFQTVQDMAKSYVNMEKKFGKDPDKLVELPSENASDEVKAEFYKRLGVPDDPSEYGFEKSTELPEDIEVDDQLLEGAKQLAHKYNMPKEAFSGLVNDWLQLEQQSIQEKQKQVQQELDSEYESSVNSLRKEWGDDYDRRVNRANRLLTQFAGEEAVEELGLSNSPKMVQFLDKVADSMSEDKLEGSGTNPLPTPAQVESKISELMAHPAYMNKKHPEHKNITDQISNLFKRKAESA